MSRIHKDLSEFVTMTTGVDHVIGAFVQISDRRYASSAEDIQGEGYVLDWDTLFKFSINHIEAETEDLTDEQKLLELCNKFADKLGKTIEM